MTNKQFFRSQMNLTLYQEVPHAEALDSALTERMRVEAKNIADRTPGLTDIAWQVERGKIESKLSVLKGNIERITLEGGSAHSYTTWLERYNAINCGLQAVRDAYMPLTNGVGVEYTLAAISLSIIYKPSLLHSIIRSWSIISRALSSSSTCSSTNQVSIERVA